MSFLIDDEKLLEKYKAIWTKIEALKNIELNALSVYNDRYVKTKIRTYGNKVYTKRFGLNVPGDDTECESFIQSFILILYIYSTNIIFKYI